MTNRQNFVPDSGNTRLFRDALGQFATGVTVITAQADKGPIGMTANSFSSVSLTPPLVLWSPAKTSDRYPHFVKAKHFAIHVLRDDQAALAQDFANSGTCFDHGNWTRNAQNVPILNSCLAHFECRLVARHDAGDHDILIGHVDTASIGDGAPLLFCKGQFGQYSGLPSAD